MNQFLKKSTHRQTPTITQSLQSLACAAMVTLGICGGIHVHAQASLEDSTSAAPAIVGGIPTATDNSLAPKISFLGATFDEPLTYTNCNDLNESFMHTNKVCMTYDVLTNKNGYPVDPYLTYAAQLWINDKRWEERDLAKNYVPGFGMDADGKVVHMIFSPNKEAHEAFYAKLLNLLGEPTDQAVRTGGKDRILCPPVNIQLDQWRVARDGAQIAYWETDTYWARYISHRSGERAEFEMGLKRILNGNTVPALYQGYSIDYYNPNFPKRELDYIDDLYVCPQ